jgi:hypothetical protein
MLCDESSDSSSESDLYSSDDESSDDDSSDDESSDDDSSDDDSSDDPRARRIAASKSALRYFDFPAYISSFLASSRNCASVRVLKSFIYLVTKTFFKKNVTNRIDRPMVVASSGLTDYPHSRVFYSSSSSSFS